MRYPVSYIVTTILCGWLLTGCSQRSEVQETIREILNSGETTRTTTIEPASHEVLKTISMHLRSDEATAPLEILQLLHRLPAGEYGALMLVEATKSRRLEVRRNAVSVLGMLRSEWAIPLLRRATDDSSASVRRGALHGLRSIAPEQSRFLFLLGLKDSAWEVRAEAAAALAALGDPSTLKYLTRRLDEKDDYALYQIVAAIRDIADGEQVADFQAMLAKPASPLHAEVATLILANLRALPGSEPLRDLLLGSECGWRLLGVDAYVQMDPRGALQLAEESALTHPRLSAALRTAVQNAAH